MPIDSLALGEAPAVVYLASVVEFNLQNGTTKIDRPMPSTYHYVINSGHFAGKDQRDLIREAIVWWESELDGIDARVSRETITSKTPSN